MEGLCRSDREELASGLARVGSVAASGLCRVAESTSASEPGIDVGEMLRQATGLSARETKDMVVVASELRDMPEVAERFASGKMTFGHVKALAAAAQEVGAEMVNPAEGVAGSGGWPAVGYFPEAGAELGDPGDARCRCGSTRPAAAGPPRGDMDGLADRDASAAFRT